MKVTFLLGSQSDTDHAEKIAKTLDEFGVPHETIIASAHKVPEKVVAEIERLNADAEPQVVITIVGMSNGLAGVVAGSCIHPVVNCPPHKSDEEYLADIHSSLRMPSYIPVMTVLNPKNAALSAIKILAEGDKTLQKKMAETIKEIKGNY